MKSKSNKKILILGAGFAGLAASKELASFGEVTVIAPNSSFEFSPNIHELVSGFKNKEDVLLDVREILEGRNQDFVQDRAVALDKKNQLVKTSSGAEHHYDCLIVAIGGISNDRGVEGVNEYTFPFKTASDCHKIGQKLARLENRKLPFSVTIVGGGVEGVESLGEILRKYNLSNNLTINLVEAENQLLPGMSGQVHRDILNICKDLPVFFHFGKRVSQVEVNRVVLSNGVNIHSDMIIWTGGVRSHPQLAAWGLMDPGEWPEVNEFLQNKEFPNILIIGDAVDIAGGGEKQAYLALEMGQIAGRNARAILSGKRLKSYKPRNLPSVYSFGNLSCFIVYNGFALSGLPFAGLKEAIYQLNMASIQGLCTGKSQKIDILNRGYKGSISSLISFIRSPIPLLSRSRIRFSMSGQTSE